MLSYPAFIPIPGTDMKISITHVVCHYKLFGGPRNANKRFDLHRILTYDPLANNIFVESRRRKEGKDCSTVSTAILCPHIGLRTSTANMNKNGKIMHSAGLDEMRTIIAARMLERLFIDHFKVYMRVTNFRVTNYICKYDLGHQIDLNRVKKHFGSSAYYNPSMNGNDGYPGVIITSLVHSNHKTTIYLSGKINQVGGQTKDMVVSEFWRIMVAIQDFWVIEVADSSAYHRSRPVRKQGKLIEFAEVLNSRTQKRLRIY